MPYNDDDDEGLYGFDQYGYQEFDDEDGSPGDGGDYGDDSPDLFADSPELEFGMAGADWGRVGGGGQAPILDKRKAYIDPRDKAKSEFKHFFRGCSDRDADVEIAMSKIENLDNLLTLNMQLLALAACFDILYRKKGGVTKANVTAFIDDNAEKFDPIDVIRYIRFYTQSVSQ